MDMTTPFVFGGPTLSAAPSTGAGAVTAASGGTAPAGGEPAAPAAPTPAAPAAPNGDANVAAEMAKLNKYREESSLLMRTDTDPVRREQAARFVLAENGYTPTQIEAWIAARRPAPSNSSDGPEGEEDNTPSVEAQQLNALSREVQDTRVQQIKGAMDNAITQTLDPSGVVGVLLNDLKGFHGAKAGEKLPKVTEALKKRILKETVEELTQLKSREGRLDFNKILPTMQAKAAEIVEEYRAALPDASMIGRTGETDSGEEEFMALPAVKPPTYKAGMDTGKATQDIRAWAADSLTRLALGSESGTRA